MKLIQNIRLKKDKILFAGSFEEAEQQDIEEWRETSLEERLIALELQRQSAYGYDPTTSRLQRILTVVESISD